MGFQSTKSGAETQFLPLDCLAKAQAKIVFLFTDTGKGQTTGVRVDFRHLSTPHIQRYHKYRDQLDTVTATCYHISVLVADMSNYSVTNEIGTPNPN